MARYFERAQRVRRLVAQDFANVFDGGGGGGGGGGGDGGGGGGSSGGGGGGGGGVDVLLTPTAPTCAPLLHSGPGDGTTGAAAAAAATAGYAADVMTVPASLAGLPALSLPVGLGRDLGLPVGVQAGVSTRPLLISTRAVLVTEIHCNYPRCPSKSAHIELDSGRV